MTEEKWPKSRSPAAHLKHYLEICDLDGGITAAQKIAELQCCESQEYEIFAQFGRTADDRAVYEVFSGRYKQAIDQMMASAREAVRKDLVSGAVISTARSSPEEIIVVPPKFWPFLHLDYEAAKAVGQGIELYGLLFSIYGEFSESQRKIVKDHIDWSFDKLKRTQEKSQAQDREIGESFDHPLHVSARLDRTVQPKQETEKTPTRTSKSEKASTESSSHRKLDPAYTRICDLWSALTDAKRASIRTKGGKETLAKEFHSAMPDVKYSTVIREFRRFRKINNIG